MSPEIIADLKTIALAAVIAWGCTEVIKPLLSASPKRRSLLRSIALLVGGAVGWFFYPELDGQGGEIVGGGLGLAAGALDAVIVWVVKSKIKAQKVEKNEQVG